MYNFKIKSRNNLIKYYKRFFAMIISANIFLNVTVLNVSSKKIINILESGITSNFVKHRKEIEKKYYAIN